MELVYDSMVQVLFHTLKAIKFQYLYKYYIFCVHAAKIPKYYN